MLAAATGAPFDLAAGPAMRADLLRLGAEDHLLALTFHHLVFDGWSVGVLIRELELCYAAHTRRQHPHPPFAPHPVRQTSRPGSVTRRGARPLTGQVAFWRDRLRGVPALQLPADVPASERRSGPGRGVPFELPEEVTEGILRLSHERGDHAVRHAPWRRSRSCSPATPDSRTSRWRCPWRAEPAARPRI